MAITQPLIEIFSKFKRQNIQEGLVHPTIHIPVVRNVDGVIKILLVLYF